MIAAGEAVGLEVETRHLLQAAPNAVASDRVADPLGGGEADADVGVVVAPTDLQNEPGLDDAQSLGGADEGGPPTQALDAR